VLARGARVRYGRATAIPKRGHRLCLALRPRQRNEFVVKALAAVALVR